MALKTNLISYWKLEEASGTRADAHGSNTLQDNNTVLSATGKIGDGADFEKTNDEYLDITDASQTGLDISGDMSICGWLKLETVGATQMIVSKWNSGTNNRSYLFWLDTGNKLNFKVSNDGAEPTATTGVSSTALSSTATWYFVGVTYDASAGTCQFYYNGSTDGTGTGLETSIYNGTSKFILGRFETASTLNMDGLMDEIPIWDRGITSSEMSEIYNAGSGLSYDDWDTGTAYTKELTDTIVLGDTQALETQKVLGEVVTLVDDVVLTTTKVLSDTLTLVASIATLKISNQVLDETITLVETMVTRITAMLLTETINLVETLATKISALRLTETITVGDVLATLQTHIRGLTETITLSPIVVTALTAYKSLVERIAISDRLYGLLNGVNMKYVDQYISEVGTYVDQYVSSVGDYVDQYYDA